MENNIAVYKDWLEIAIGVQNNWLNHSNITNLWDLKIISLPNDDRYNDVYFAEQTSKEEILLLLKKIIYEDYCIQVPIDNNGLCIDYTLKEFQAGLKVWEYHFLYPIYISEKKINEKLENDIYDLWCDFKYFNINWDGFLWIVASRLNLSEIQLYHNFEIYIHKLKDYLASR